MTRREWFADGILVLTALIWGSGFVVMKNSLESFSPAAIIAMRYTIASALTALVFRKHLKGITRQDVLRGAFVGLMLFAAYTIQTIGLKHTTAGKNAFLTTVYVLLVPFACRVLFKEKLHRTNFIAAGLMMLGIGFLSLDGAGGGLNIGDVYTLIAGGFFAAHIVAVERCQKKMNAYMLIVLQFVFTAVYALAAYLLFERNVPLAFSPASLGGIVYLSVFSTSIAMSLQNIGQSMAPSSHASILLSLESVFGAAFSCLLLGEVLTVRMIIGFAVIFAALVINQQKTE